MATACVPRLCSPSNQLQHVPLQSFERACLPLLAHGIWQAGAQQFKQHCCTLPELWQEPMCMLQDKNSGPDPTRVGAANNNLLDDYGIGNTSIVASGKDGGITLARQGQRQQATGCVR